MAESELTGTAPVAPPAEAAPAAQQTPQVTTPQPDVSLGGGKSQEQLAAELREATELIQATNERIARMEHERELERQMRANLTAGKGQEQEAPDLDYDKLDGEFLTSPGRAMAKILDARLEKERRERDRERATQYIASARTSFETGKAEAVKSNPNLFKGISEDISREILGNVQSGLQQGQPVDVEILRNPKYWEAAAVAYRVMNGEDVSKYYGGVRTPMAPGHTETPTAGGPPQAGISLSPEQEELVSRGNITREQFIESMKRVRGEAEARAK